MRFLLVICLLSSLQSNMLKDNFFGYHDKKYYSKKDKANKKENKQPQIIITEKYLQTLNSEQYRKLKQKIKDIAVMKPTEQNVKNNLIMTKFEDTKATNYMNKYQEVILKNPNLDLGFNVEKSTFGRKIEAQVKQKEKDDFWKKNIDRISVVTFYNDDEIMKNESVEIVLNWLKLDYPKLSIRLIDINSSLGKNTLKRYDLKVYTPDIFILYRQKDNKPFWHRVAHGVVSKDEILNKIYFVFKNVIGDK